MSATNSESCWNGSKPPSNYGSISSLEAKKESSSSEDQPPETNPDFPEDDKKARYISLGVAFAVQFLLMLQNSIFFSSLWPFISTIDKSADETFFGFVMMAFPLASALSSPLFGWWSNKIHQCRLPIIVGIVISIGGNLLLACVEAFDSNRKWIVMAARFISGLGCGNYGPLYAYIVMASKVSERSRAISIRAALNSVALILGPALQTAFVPIGFPGFVAERFHLDLYTSTAWANVIAGIIQLLIVATIFKEYWVSVDKSELESKSKRTAESKVLKPFDKTAAFANIWIRFCYGFALMFDGTIGSPFSMIMFGWTSTESVLYNGIIQTSTSVVDFCGNLFMGHVVLRYVEERKTMIFGLVLALVSYFFNFSWPFLPPILTNEMIAGSRGRRKSGPKYTKHTDEPSPDDSPASSVDNATPADSYYQIHQEKK